MRGFGFFGSQPGQPHDRSNAQAGFSAPPEELWSALQSNLKLSSEHQFLRRLQGRWKVTADEDAFGYGPMISAQGEAEHRLLFGGRFLMMRTTLELAEQHYESFAFLGFDKLRGLFHYVLFESAGVAPLVTEGPWDEAEGAIRTEGTATNPMFGHCHPVALVWRLAQPGRLDLRMEVPSEKGQMASCSEATFERLESFD